jgi:2,4-dienoyl-CoA reductase-like NADH-dependent reductase (Old Yellow Enzyme family)
MPNTRVAVSPSYQVPFAADVKRAIPRLTVRAVGMIVTPAQASAVIEAHQADQIAIARAVLDNPRWGWHAAEALGVEMAVLH